MKLWHGIVVLVVCVIVIGLCAWSITKDAKVVAKNTRAYTVKVEENKRTGNAIRILNNYSANYIVFPNELECVVYKGGGASYAGGGISCNWEKFND